MTFDPITKVPTVVVTNVGRGAVTKWGGTTISIGWYGNGSTIYKRDKNAADLIRLPFAPGDRVNIAFDAPPANAKSYSAIVFPRNLEPPEVDAEAVANNINSTNNVFDGDVPVFPLPDLKLESVTFNPSTRKPQVKVTNVGKSAVVDWGGTTVGIGWYGLGGTYLNSKNQNTATFSPLPFAVGDSFAVEFEDPPLGAISYSANVFPRSLLPSEIDAEAVANEINLTNNVLDGIVPYSALPLPDLKLESVTFDQTQVPTVKITNVGDAPITSFSLQVGSNTLLANVQLAWTDSNRSLIADPISRNLIDIKGALGVGETMEVAFNPPPTGAVFFRAQVNLSPHVFKEKDEEAYASGQGGNNELWGDVSALLTPTPTLSPVPTPALVTIDTGGLSLFGKLGKTITTLGDKIKLILPLPQASPTPSPAPTIEPTDKPKKLSSPTSGVSTLPTSILTPTLLLNPTLKPTAAPPSTPIPSTTLPTATVTTPVQNLKYPVEELGNCQNKEDCARYCDLDENFNACNEYAVKMGLRTREEAERLRNARNVKSGPGGCDSQESCAAYCDKPENLNVCLDYAEKNNLMSADELEKTKKALKAISSGTKTPGGCQTPKTCQAYCSGGAQVDECLEFAKGAGLLSGDEAKEMEKGKDFLKKGGPGGCKSKEECESYCEKDDHEQECEAFFKNAGVSDSKSGDRSGKPPKTGGGAGCTTREECEVFHEFRTSSVN